MNTKQISAALLLLAVISSAVACGNASESAPADTTASQDQAQETVMEAETEPVDEFGRELIDSALPDDLDFGGDTVTLIYRPEENGLSYYYEFDAPEENGETVNDAVYTRNRAVEEKLNVKLNIHMADVSDNGGFESLIKKSVKAGDGSYDIFPLYGYHGAALAPEGYFYDLKSMPYIDLSKPWWNQNFIEEMTVYGSLWNFVGDMSLTSTQFTFATFYNKNMFANYFPGVDLYSEVDDGKWTIDRFGDLVKDAYSDLNGNGQRDNGDFFAWYAPAASTPIDSFQASLDLPLTRWEDDTPVFVYNSEKAAQAYQKVLALFHNNDGVKPGKYTFESIEEARDAFSSDLSIFLIDIIRMTETLRAMNSDYGVLPVFKWNEEQAEYHTTAQDAYSLIAVSAATQKPETVAAVLEAMGEYSYRYVTPAYFEIALKRKYARDDNDSRMYDIIIYGRTFNFGVVNSKSLNDMVQQWRSLIEGNKDTWISTIEKFVPKVEKSLDKLMTKYADISGG
ncbi:MAG: extracellular solute-binding protein [Clostridiales bacterium]|nr:extracellular solute-binding protein [Clostridiales bacterium]